MPDFKQVLQFDSPDERREIQRLVGRLSPNRRVEFLQWCCTQARLTPTSSSYPRVGKMSYELADKARWDSSANARLNIDIVMSVYSLTAQYEFNLERALLKLVEWVRGRE